MKKFFTFAALFLFIISVAAQTKSIKNSPPLVEAAAASVGMSQERLDLIDAMCKEAVGNNSIPGGGSYCLLHSKSVVG